MKQELSGNKISKTLGFLLIYFLLFRMPIVKYYVNTYLSMGLLVVMCYFLLMNNIGYINAVPKLLVGTALYFIITLGDEMFFKTDFLYALWSAFLESAPLMVGLLLLQMDADKQIRRMVWLTILIYGIIAITTYSGLQEYPMASRQLATGHDYGISYSSLNIGGFEYIYSVPIVLPMFVCVLRRAKKTLLAVAITVLLGMCVIESEYTLAVISFMLSLVAYFLPVRDDIRIGRRRTVTLVIVFMVCLIFAADIFTWLASLEIFEGTSIADKLLDIARMFTGEGAAESNTQSRQELYRASWDAFWKSPIFGNWLLNGLEDGGHSFFLDTIARWGILGLLIVIFVIRHLHRLFKSLANGSSVYFYALLSLLIAMFISFVNPQFWAFELGTVVPLFLYATVCPREEKNLAAEHTDDLVSPVYGGTL